MEDVWHGKGVLTTQDTKFDGTFEGGVKQGFGTLVWSSGQQYSGLWIQNSFHGEGIWKFCSGFQKRGDFKQGVRIEWTTEKQEWVLKQGKALHQGQWLTSQNKKFNFVLNSDGTFSVMNEKREKIKNQEFMAIKKRAIKPPFFLRLETNGSVIAIDSNNAEPYYESHPVTGIPPFCLTLDDDGDVKVYDLRGPLGSIFT